ncbi:MAG TPA: oligopeptide:H+ symporter [Flavobacteriaceae bacterium]|nr:oligopeptide:H+ symporter [Flavobacteriaceae bacterium]MCB9213947.1 MFS transporter [Alteromonas sp.]HPF11068.1 oligopeptide:H+ symporter [Flavobacteriaceae bacterium]HQU22137.1 oligopeptide:H+ symporter [Flavobacteriaceae bacterium]HQU64295.1 oligopeptide:H+ symporter [Flavobacteriaceae bacterium]
MNTDTKNFFDTKVMGHPAGLFVLFFTEMWERFSYYGMRILLVAFFSASILDLGWGWPKEHALAIFGTYTALVYLSTMIGGYFADNVIGYRWAVVVGALLMTMGHGCMALESPFFIYTGLTLLVFGSGFFKPNMTSIISEMYKDVPEKKDGAYTIFYMGVNAGAFFGIMLCGYLGEKVGWSWGFGLAGIFMLFGLLQFWFAQGIFGDVGKKPKKKQLDVLEIGKEPENKEELEGYNPFTPLQKVLVVVSAALGLLWIFNDPISKITEGEKSLFQFSIGGWDGNSIVILAALVLFIVLLMIRIPKYLPVVRDRMIAIVFFAFITVFFWAVFEQAPGSLTLFARDYTQRILTEEAGVIFKIVDALITLVPLAIISYVLFRLFQKTFSKYPFSNLFLAASFIIIWGIAIWKVQNDYKSAAYDITYFNNNGIEKSAEVVSSNPYEKGDKIPILDVESVSFFDKNAKENQTLKVMDNMLFSDDSEMGEIFDGTIVEYKKEKKIGAGIMINKAVVEFVNAQGKTITKTLKVPKEDLTKYPVGKAVALQITHDISFNKTGSKEGVDAVVEAKKNAVEIPFSWFNILNSLFIIALAPFFSRWWESKYNPAANSKYAIGMLLLGLGMAVIAIGASGIPAGAKTASVSIIWLILVYLFHTMGELCVSPVALSYVSKLVPGRMIAVMFGVWYLAVAIGMKLAGLFGEFSEEVSKEAGLSTFFWYLTIVSVALSAIALFTTPIFKKLMHGVR